MVLWKEGNFEERVRDGGEERIGVFTEWGMEERSGRDRRV